MFDLWVVDDPQHNFSCLSEVDVYPSLRPIIHVHVQVVIQSWTPGSNLILVAVLKKADRPTRALSTFSIPYEMLLLSTQSIVVGQNTTENENGWLDDGCRMKMKVKVNNKHM